MKTKAIVRKISRGLRQHRVTVPKDWKSDYVVISPLETERIKLHKRYFR